MMPGRLLRNAASTLLAKDTLTKRPLSTHCGHPFDARQRAMNSASPLPTLFLNSLCYDLASRSVVLSANEHPAVEVRFEPPREFRSFTESDNHAYLGSYQGRLLVASTEQGCGIWMSETAPYLLDYRERARWQGQEPEETFSCLIATPQECVEVICFEEPSVRIL
jgi:hypothetical protein